jgi:hypothetical protein
MRLESGWARAGVVIVGIVLVSAVVRGIQGEEDAAGRSDPEDLVSKTASALKEGEQAYFKKNRVYTAHYTDLLVTGRYSQVWDGLLDPDLEVELDLSTNAKAVTIIVTHEDPAIRGYITLDRGGTYGAGGYGATSP